MMSNQRNVENFCLCEAAESSLEVSAHSDQLLESNNDVEPKKCGKLLSVHSDQLLESNNDVEPKKCGKLLSAHSGQLLGVKQ